MCEHQRPTQLTHPLCQVRGFLGASACFFAVAGTGYDKWKQQRTKNIEETRSIVICSDRHGKPMYIKHEDCHQKRQVSDDYLSNNSFQPKIFVNNETDVLKTRVWRCPKVVLKQNNYKTRQNLPRFETTFSQRSSQMISGLFSTHRSVGFIRGLS